MFSLKATNTSFAPSNHGFFHARKPSSTKNSILCLCKSNDSESESPPPEGDAKKQELLAKIAMLQTQKVRLTDYLDERSAYLTQFAEEANAEFDKIGEDALKGLDEAGARIMENIESQMQAFEESAELNRTEIEKNDNKVADFEGQMEKDRNEGMFFKNLGQKAPADKAKAKEEAQRIKDLTYAKAGSKTILKLLIDSKHNKVVFAEAGKDFVDFLLSLLTLPLGTVIQLITKSAMKGCIANLYGSLEKLDQSYLQPNQNKDSILNPTITTQITNPSFLLPNTNRKPEDQKLYYCPRHPGSVSNTQKTLCSPCRSQGYGSPSFSQEVKFAGTNVSTSTDTATSDQGGYVKGLATYTVTDDLSVSPLSMVSVVILLNKLNIKDFGVLKEKIVEFGIDEGIELLKASLLSKDALTAVFLLKDRDGAPVSN